MCVSACHIKVHFSCDCVGSILRVTTADQYASGKTSQFLGICIQRSGAGLGATFILRNTIEGQGRFLCISLIFWKVFSQDSILCSDSGIRHLQLLWSLWPENGPGQRLLSRRSARCRPVRAASSTAQ